MADKPMLGTLLLYCLTIIKQNCYNKWRKSRQVPLPIHILDLQRSTTCLVSAPFSSLINFLQLGNPTFALRSRDKVMLRCSLTPETYLQRNLRTCSRGQVTACQSQYQNTFPVSGAQHTRIRTTDPFIRILMENTHYLSHFSGICAQFQT